MEELRWEGVESPDLGSSSGWDVPLEMENYPMIYRASGANARGRALAEAKSGRSEGRRARCADSAAVAGKGIQNAITVRKNGESRKGTAMIGFVVDNG